MDADEQPGGDGDREDEQDAPAGGTDPEPDPPRRRLPRPLAVGLRAAVALVSAVALLGSGVVWYAVHHVAGSANTTGALRQLQRLPGASAVPQPPADDGATDILLIGTDSRTDAQGDPLPRWRLKQLRTTAADGVNTDTIILLRIPKDGGRAYAISIPRDSYVEIPGIGKHKINAAFGLTKAATRRRLLAQGETNRDTIREKSQTAGRAALAGAVQNLTGVRVDHYAEINLIGFYLLSKAIGGVTVCLRAPTHDKDSGADFPAGVQTISGSDALSFVRQRKHIPGGGLARIQRQQVFLASAAKKLLSAGTLTDPKRVSALADTARRALTMDPGLHLLDLLKQAQSLASGRVTFVTIPVVTINGRSPDGRSIVEVDPKRVRGFVHGLLDSASAPPAATTSVHPSAYVVHGGTEPTPPVTIDGHRCVY